MVEIKNTQGATSDEVRALAEGEATVPASSSLRDGDPSRVYIYDFVDKLYWRDVGCGITSDLTRAHQYKPEEAENLIAGAEHFLRAVPIAQAMEARQGGDAEGGSGVADSATPSGDVPEISPTLDAPEGSSGEIEELMDGYTHEVAQMAMAPWCADIDLPATHRRVYELRTALLSRITSLSSNTSGRDPSGPGSREPGPTVPAPAGASIPGADRVHEAVAGASRRAYDQMAFHRQAADRARDQRASREDAQRLRPEAASPVDEVEAPASIYQDPPAPRPSQGEQSA